METREQDLQKIFLVKTNCLVGKEIKVNGIKQKIIDVHEDGKHVMTEESIPNPIFIYDKNVKIVESFT